MIEMAFVSVNGENSFDYTKNKYKYKSYFLLDGGISSISLLKWLVASAAIISAVQSKYDMTGGRRK